MHTVTSGTLYGVKFTDKGYKPGQQLICCPTYCGTGNIDLLTSLVDLLFPNNDLLNSSHADLFSAPIDLLICCLHDIPWTLTYSVAMLTYLLPHLTYLALGILTYFPIPTY